MLEISIKGKKTRRPFTEEELGQQERDRANLLENGPPPMRTIADDIADLKAENAALQKKLGVTLTEEDIAAEKSAR